MRRHFGSSHKGQLLLGKEMPLLHRPMMLLPFTITRLA
jgi:hypothetical protein